MTTPALERAARAAYEAWIDDVRDLEPAWEDLPESHRYRLIQSVRAVLMAVREPGQQMVDDMHGRDPLGCDVEYKGEIYPPIWQAGIDAILGEGERE